MNNQFLKAITLTVFILLIVGFVAFQADMFENEQQKKDSSGFIVLPEAVNPPEYKVSPDMLPTSKSIIMIKQESRFAADSLMIPELVKAGFIDTSKKNADKTAESQASGDSAERIRISPEMLSTSKSMVLTHPKLRKQLDSIFADTANRQELQKIIDPPKKQE
jgi:hypothetical protein